MLMKPKILSPILMGLMATSVAHAGTIINDASGNDHIHVTYTPENLKHNRPDLEPMCSFHEGLKVDEDNLRAVLTNDLGMASGSVQMEWHSLKDVEDYHVPYLPSIEGRAPWNREWSGYFMPKLDSDVPRVDEEAWFEAWFDYIGIEEIQIKPSLIIRKHDLKTLTIDELHDDFEFAYFVGVDSAKHTRGNIAFMSGNSWPHNDQWRYPSSSTIGSLDNRAGYAFSGEVVESPDYGEPLVYIKFHEPSSLKEQHTGGIRINEYVIGITKGPNGEWFEPDENYLYSMEVEIFCYARADQ